MSPETSQRPVPAQEISRSLNELHDRLLVGNPDGAHLVQIHEFLDIDADIADRVYPPFTHTHPAVDFSEPCHCGSPIPANRVAYCSDRCRNEDRGE